MQADRKPVAISCLILLGVFICCLCMVTVLAFSILLVPDQITNLQPQNQPTPFDFDSLPTPTSSDNSSELPQDLLVQMRQIQQEVIAKRQLLPEYEVSRKFLTPDELRTVVEEEMFADYTEETANLDSTVLSTFGLVDPEQDLLQFYQDLYSEQIAGYYDPETGEMNVIKGGEFGLNERLTYAHEYTHVLQDQNFDIKEELRYDDEYCEGETERCAAVQALIEGDASLLEYEWQSEYFSKEDFREWLSNALEMQFPALDAAAPYFQQDLYFPYLYGLNFVSYIYERGGWDAVNDAYANPPISTEQIMHPELYPADSPQEVKIDEIHSPNLRDFFLIDEGEAGEWFTYQYLTQGIEEGLRLDERTAKNATSGWDGGYYVVYKHHSIENPVVVTCNIWDSGADAREFFDAYKQYGDLHWVEIVEDSSDQRIWTEDFSFSNVRINGTRTCWTNAHTREAMEAASNVAMNP